MKLVVSHAFGRQSRRARRIEQQSPDENFIAGLDAAKSGHVNKNGADNDVHINQADA